MEIAILIVFIVGYLLIAFEHPLDINKTAIALVTGVVCWTIYIIYSDPESVMHQLIEQVGEVSGILFFLMGAMTIVELIDAHDGFELINSRIRTNNSRKLLWITAGLTFMLSAVLDNLTTTIVMVTLVGKLVSERRTKMLFVGMIILAANAGGAWSPIGDITTTMLWIGGQISASTIVVRLIVPSMVSVLVPLSIMHFMINGKTQRVAIESDSNGLSNDDSSRKIVLVSGLLALLCVPVFKTLTHLPPFMGMLLALGILWILVEIIHRKADKEQRRKLSVVHALQRMDTPSVLFFLGILLAVGVLQHTGELTTLASWLADTFERDEIILSVIGILSAIIDNVPLVAATIGMYSLDTYPMDHSFWILLAYCAGTGGSLLVIGSAAGVAAMGIEDIPFGWYLKNISWLAFIGYLAGIGAFLLMSAL